MSTCTDYTRANRNRTMKCLLREPIVSADETEARTRVRTLRHLGDILRAHGIGARWANLNIPAERASRICGHYAPDRSLSGSSADMCTTADGSGW